MTLEVVKKPLETKIKAHIQQKSMKTKWNLECILNTIEGLCFYSQVYELTLHHTQHQDHNVVTGALELLQQLFRTPPPELLQALTTPGGLGQLTVVQEEARGRGRSGSIVELLGMFSASSSNQLYNNAHILLLLYWTILC